MNEPITILEYGTPVYSVIETGIFGLRVICGVIIGVQLTNNEPRYCIGYEKNSYWVNKVALNKDDLLNMLQVPNLSDVANIGADVNFPEKDVNNLVD